MALSDEVVRKIYLYFGVTQALASGDLLAGALAVTTPITHRLQTAVTHLTAAGETTVVQLVTILDDKWQKLQDVDDSLLVEKAGPVTLRRDELIARQEQFDFYLARLDATLFPDGQGLLGGAAGMMQGPYGEP